MRYFLTFFIFTIYSFGFNYHIKPYKITNGITCMFGLDKEISRINGGRVINTCYIQTPKGYIVVDSGPTYSYAKQAYSAMQKRKNLPVKYVINTSAQEVNILGNGFYKKMGAKILSPLSYKDRLRYKRPQIARKISADAFSKTRIVTSHGYINRYKKLSIGGIDIIIKNLENSSSKNLIVFVPKYKTLFAGNYIYVSLGEHKSFWSWNRAIKKIESMKWKYIIPSHGIKIRRTALNGTKSYIKHHLKKIHTREQVKQDNQQIVEEIYIAKPIHYTHNFSRAIRKSIRDNKLVMIKVEADNCKPCKQLDIILETNNKIKRLINQNIRIVKVNIDHQEKVPLDLNYMGTPTIFLIQPETKKVLMKLQGVIPAKDLEESLRMFIDDSVLDNQ